MDRTGFETYQVVLNRLYEEIGKTPLNPDNVKALTEALKVIPHNMSW